MGVVLIQWTHSRLELDRPQPLDYHVQLGRQGRSLRRRENRGSLRHAATPFNVDVIAVFRLLTAGPLSLLAPFLANPLSKRTYLLCRHSVDRGEHPSFPHVLRFAYQAPIDLLEHDGRVVPAKVELLLVIHPFRHEANALDASRLARCVEPR